MVVAVSMMKDEIDIVRATVGWMLTQVDHVLVADNGSGDGTREALLELTWAGTDPERDELPGGGELGRTKPGQLTVQDDPDPAYYQSDKMTRLAHLALHKWDADWIVPFDADECWMADGRVADVLEELPPEALIAEATVFDHVATPAGIDYRRAQATPLRKVAVRARNDLVIHQGNHGASYDERYPLTVTGQLEVRHFPYRSPAQMIHKARNGAAAYAATDLPENVGAHWRGYGRLSDDQIDEVFHEYFYSGDPADDPELVLDPCPVSSALSLT